MTDPESTDVPFEVVEEVQEAAAEAVPDEGPTEVAEADEQRAADEALSPEDEVSAALEEAERRAEEYLDHLRRERAEFDNFRKRMQRERMEALDRGTEQLVANLLGVLDNFGYTLAAAETSEDDQLAKGVQMVHTELLAVLGQAGLEEVPGSGAAFDPNVHEAVAQDEAPEPLDEPVVSEVLRPGYAFKGRVLRPASVKVQR